MCESSQWENTCQVLESVLQNLPENPLLALDQQLPAVSDIQILTIFPDCRLYSLLAYVCHHHQPHIIILKYTTCYTA